MVDEEQELLVSGRKLQSGRFFKIEPEVLSRPEVDDCDDNCPGELCRRSLAEMYIRRCQRTSSLFVCCLLCLQLDIIACCRYSL